jgi:succinyl-CoA synthetase beta subunit
VLPVNIYEYQGKALLRSFGVPVPHGYPAGDVNEARAAAAKLPGPLYMVKSQIRAGGRGIGRFKELRPDAMGGVRIASSPEEVGEHAAEMLGNTLVTAQTGPGGEPVNRLYIEEGVEIDRELYLSAVVDPESGQVAFVVSTDGGADIEKVARETPRKILTVAVDPLSGVLPQQGRSIAGMLGLGGDQAVQAASLIPKLYAAFIAKDMALLELNPLIVSKSGELQCLDAKIGFDPHALRRHPDIVALESNA